MDRQGNSWSAAPLLVNNKPTGPVSNTTSNNRNVTNFSESVLTGERRRGTSRTQPSSPIRDRGGFGRFLAFGRSDPGIKRELHLTGFQKSLILGPLKNQIEQIRHETNCIISIEKAVRNSQGANPINQNLPFICTIQGAHNNVLKAYNTILELLQHHKSIHLQQRSDKLEHVSHTRFMLSPNMKELKGNLTMTIALPAGMSRLLSAQSGQMLVSATTTSTNLNVLLNVLFQGFDPRDTSDNSEINKLFETLDENSSVQFPLPIPVAQITRDGLLMLSWEAEVDEHPEQLERIKSTIKAFVEKRSSILYGYIQAVPLTSLGVKCSAVSCCILGHQCGRLIGQGGSNIHRHTQVVHSQIIQNLLTHVSNDENIITQRTLPLCAVYIPDTKSAVTKAICTTITFNDSNKIPGITTYKATALLFASVTRAVAHTEETAGLTAVLLEMPDDWCQENQTNIFAGSFNKVNGGKYRNKSAIILLPHLQSEMNIIKNENNSDHSQHLSKSNNNQRQSSDIFPSPNYLDNHLKDNGTMQNFGKTDLQRQQINIPSSYLDVKSNDTNNINDKRSSLPVTFPGIPMNSEINNFHEIKLNSTTTDSNSSSINNIDITSNQLPEKSIKTNVSKFLFGSSIQDNLVDSITPPTIAKDQHQKENKTEDNIPFQLFSYSAPCSIGGSPNKRQFPPFDSYRKFGTEDYKLKNIPEDENCEREAYDSFNNYNGYGRSIRQPEKDGAFLMEQLRMKLEKRSIDEYESLHPVTIKPGNMSGAASPSSIFSSRSGSPKSESEMTAASIGGKPLTNQFEGNCICGENEKFRSQVHSFVGEKNVFSSSVTPPPPISEINNSDLSKIKFSTDYKGGLFNPFAQQQQQQGKFLHQDSFLPSNSVSISSHDNQTNMNNFISNQNQPFLFNPGIFTPAGSSIHTRTNSFEIQYPYQSQVLHSRTPSNNEIKNITANFLGKYKSDDSTDTSLEKSLSGNNNINNNNLPPSREPKISCLSASEAFTKINNSPITQYTIHIGYNLSDIYKTPKMDAEVNSLDLVGTRLSRTTKCLRFDETTACRDPLISNNTPVDAAGKSPNAKLHIQNRKTLYGNITNQNTVMLPDRKYVVATTTDFKNIPSPDNTKMNSHIALRGTVFQCLLALARQYGGLVGECPGSCLLNPKSYPSNQVIESISSFGDIASLGELSIKIHPGKSTFAGGYNSSAGGPQSVALTPDELAGLLSDRVLSTRFTNGVYFNGDEVKCQNFNIHKKLRKLHKSNFGFSEKEKSPYKIIEDETTGDLTKSSAVWHYTINSQAHTVAYSDFMRRKDCKPLDTEPVECEKFSTWCPVVVEVESELFSIKNKDSNMININSVTDRNDLVKILDDYKSKNKKCKDNHNSPNDETAKYEDVLKRVSVHPRTHSLSLHVPSNGGKNNVDLLVVIRGNGKIRKDIWKNSKNIVCKNGNNGMNALDEFVKAALQTPETEAIVSGSNNQGSPGTVLANTVAGSISTHSISIPIRSLFNKKFDEQLDTIEEDCKKGKYTGNNSHDQIPSGCMPITLEWGGNVGSELAPLVVKETTKLQANDSPYDLKLLVETRKIIEVGKDNDKTEHSLENDGLNEGSSKQHSSNVNGNGSPTGFVKYPIVFTICSKIPNIKDEKSLNRFCCILSDAIRAVRDILNKCI